MPKKFEYRLVKKTYHNRIEWEDGPGSLRNIVTDESSYVLWKTSGDERYGQRLVEDGIDYGELDSPDGFIEYSYVLERRESPTDEWHYVGHPKLRSRDDEYYDDEDH